MKTSLISLALTLGLASTSAFAADGQINFSGEITNGTCAVEVVDPGSNNPTNQIGLGEFRAGFFTAANVTTYPHPFQLRVTPGGGCIPGTNKKATVTFSTPYTASGTHYGVRPGLTNPATGIAVAIRDPRTGTFVAHGTPSADFDLAPGSASIMSFDAMLISTAAAVTAGSVEADVELVITPN
ncbi:pilus assembly protein [Pseudomonas sp. SDI]|uniref:fimbrial protein n=1 Tax=Pseudomonas sp. SDI TaxID=2170734 RepID=UPI000DE5D022|nr:fimbrial protein [Pseudomonas sp. SDI]PWB30715.1 pilus assembly protein [Pseudomonas sp. SDI]